MAVGIKKFTMEYVVPKIRKNLKERFDTKQKAFKSIDEKGKGLSIQKRSEIKKSFSGKASKIFDDASKARKGKMGGGMMGRRMGYSEGKLAVTPREKQLAAQYGDKKRITRGDVITAAKKKSGKRMQASVGGGADMGRKPKKRGNPAVITAASALPLIKEDPMRDRKKQPLKRKKP